MLINEARNVLGVTSNASKEEIKKAYKEIALTCHPDKLLKIISDDERKQRIDKFKNSTIAYELLINLQCCDADDDIMNDDYDWKDLFMNVCKYASNYMQEKKLSPKDRIDTAERIVHSIKFEVTYAEIAMNTKRKLRLILAGIQDPIFVDVYCGSFPRVVKEYTYDEDDSNSVEHDIIINMEIKSVDGFDHIIHPSGTIDIVTSINVSMIDYILGYTKDIPDILTLGTQGIQGTLSITVPPFQKDYYEVEGKGIKKGSLVLNINLDYVKQDVWEALDELGKAELIRSLKKLV
jgi:DnaJ-class molecular chaperone